MPELPEFLACNCTDGNSMNSFRISPETSKRFLAIAYLISVGNDNQLWRFISGDTNGNDRGRTFDLLFKAKAYEADKEFEIMYSSSLFTQLISGADGKSVYLEDGSRLQSMIEKNILKYTEIHYKELYDLIVRFGLEVTSTKPKLAGRIQDLFHEAYQNVREEISQYTMSEGAGSYTDYFASIGVQKEFSKNIKPTWSCFLKTNVELGISSNSLERVFVDTETWMGIRSSRKLTRDISSWEISTYMKGRKTKGLGREYSFGLKLSYALESDSYIWIPSFQVSKYRYHEDRHMGQNELDTDEPYYELGIQVIPKN